MHQSAYLFDFYFVYTAQENLSEQREQLQKISH